MAGMQFIVSGNSVEARDLVLSVFHQNHWSVTLKSDWEATAEHGSKAASILVGAFAGKSGRHVILNISISVDTYGYTVITLITGTSGASGGAIGVSQANNIYKKMYENIGVALSSAGIYVSNMII